MARRAGKPAARASPPRRCQQRATPFARESRKRDVLHHEGDFVGDHAGRCLIVKRERLGRFTQVEEVPDSDRVGGLAIDFVAEMFAAVRVPLSRISSTRTVTDPMVRSWAPASRGKAKASVGPGSRARTTPLIDSIWRGRPAGSRNGR